MNSTALPLHLATGPPAENPAPRAGNTLFPVFLKLEHLRVLLVGGGAVGLEQITALLRNSPAASITVVSDVISPEIRTLAAQHPAVQLHERPYQLTDLLGHDLVLIATNDRALNSRIKQEAAGHGLLANVADTPEECDFYLGAIVQKGDLKVAISTNGKSPTVAQRLREVLSEALPDELNAVLQNLGVIRRRLAGDFTQKVKSLNEVTAELAESPETTMWRRIATFSLFGFALLLGLNVLSIYYTWPQVWDTITTARTFYLFVAVGFAAQLVDGLLGMGYGVVTAISLMSLGLNPAAVSASIHTAEMFASGASGYNHYRFGNVNRRLFKALLIPGILGSVSGALLLSKFGEQYGSYVKPVLAAYLLLLGVRLISKAFTKPDLRKRKVKHVGWLAGAGGFLDSFGGGGWGPLVTSTLISQGRTPQYVIGSVSLTEFFVTFASALTFFATIGISHWQVVLGLIVGGVAAAPFAARLAGRVSTRFMFVGVGLMVIVWSLWALRKVFF
ncbi:TSUP family transporter [Hymenobacter jeollabukensis]|uniref:Probable membrane transporter protein n=1 Tax=Hymenobacter jeollabukensis TaxID=2025313 RepID=A0A5R8WVH2_9BACT|nr:TSUP family transporter [Hymenobacter jeollabukensis]TLM95483.1 ABC transporter permease [Hymenobacter jeollabukensis]